ncbi:MAG: hypothetical protein RI933_1230 [Actinomycetota bacterium]
MVNWKIAGVYFWPVLRERMMREVLEQLGIYERRVEQPKVARKAPSEFHIPQSKYAVIPFLRRDAAGVDPFSADILRILDEADARPLIFGMGDADLVSDNPQVAKRPHLEELEAEFAHRYRRRAQLRVLPAYLNKRSVDRSRWKNFIVSLNAALSGLVADLSARTAQSLTSKYAAFPTWLIVDFIAKRIGWKKLFRQTSVQKLFVVNAWKRPLIAGAQDAGVWVVEPQHGLLSEFHPLFSFSGRVAESRQVEDALVESAEPLEAVAYLPNELYTWGEFWGENLGAPKSLQISVVGAPSSMAERMGKGLASAVRLPGSVLIASQAQQTSKLFELAVRAAKANPDLQITLKPHPQETREQYRQLIIDFAQAEAASEAAGATGPDSAATAPSFTPRDTETTSIKVAYSYLPSNFKLANPDEPALPLIAKSEFVVGVHSMALVEAIALGAKVIALKLPGFEHVRAIAERGDLLLAEADSDLSAEFAAARIAGNPLKYFAKPLSPEQYSSLVLSLQP